MSTINPTQIPELPLKITQRTLGFVIMLPGVSTPRAPRDSTPSACRRRPSTSRLTASTRITNNFQRDTDGFYSMVFPQLDAVEQVTVTGVRRGAEGASGWDGC